MRQTFAFISSIAQQGMNVPSNPGKPTRLPGKENAKKHR